MLYLVGLSTHYISVYALSGFISRNELCYMFQLKFHYITRSVKTDTKFKTTHVVKLLFFALHQYKNSVLEWYAILFMSCSTYTTRCLKPTLKVTICGPSYKECHGWVVKNRWCEVWSCHWGLRGLKHCVWLTRHIRFPEKCCPPKVITTPILQITRCLCATQSELLTTSHNKRSCNTNNSSLQTKVSLH